MSVDERLENSETVDFMLAERHGLPLPEESDVSDAAFDMLEHHRAREQAHLLQRFKELRQAQQQQQQQLMQQQYQQLKAWKEEQEKVQMLIAAQQVSHWSQGLKGGGGRPAAILTPPSKPPIPIGNHIQVNERTQVNQTNGAGISVDSGLASSMQDTLKSQNSLPKPVMYFDPSKSGHLNDEDKYTDSDLFSNPAASDDQLDILGADNPDPVPDWMSDDSDHYNPPRLPPPRPIRGGKNGIVNDQLASLEHFLHTAPLDLLQQVRNLLPVKSKLEDQPDYTDEVELSASPTLPQPGQQPRARKLHFQQMAPATVAESSGGTRQPQLYDRQQQQLHDLQVNRQQRQQHHQNKNFNLNQMMGGTGQDLWHAAQVYASTDFNPGGRHTLPGDILHDDDSNDEWEDQEEEEEDDDSYDNHNITAKEIQNTSRDDRPIHGLPGKKSFEQLLEEQLKAEEKKLEDQKREIDKPFRKPFLKKGEGISRFNSAPKKTVKKFSRKPDHKISVGQTGSKSRNIARDKNKAEAKHLSDHGDGNKKASIGCAAKDKITAKAAERKVKITTTFKSSSPETVPGKPAAKLAFIHNAAGKKTEEQRPQEKESIGGQHSKDSVGYLSNGQSELDRSPSQASRSDRSEDRDSTELDSLAEFELLEDAVENISFRSNSSLVHRLMASDRQSQKEVMKRLRTITEARIADANLPSEPANHVSSTSVQKDNGFQKVGVATLGTSQNSSDNCDRNNSSNVQPTATHSDVSDTTLTDSSAEEDNAGRSSHFRNGESPVQNGFAAAGDVLPGSKPPSSPTKVITRKVAPMAAKFAAANDTLAMLKLLSLRAGILTADSGSVSHSAGINSKPGPMFPTVSSFASIHQKVAASDGLENHHSIQQNIHSSLAPSRFPGSSNVPMASNLTPVIDNNAQLPLVFNQTSWLNSIPVLPNMSSAQVSSENGSSLSYKNISNKANSATGSFSTKLTGSFHESKLTDNFHHESSSSSSSEKDSNDSGDSDDDSNEANRVSLADRSQDISHDADPLNKEPHSFPSVPDDVETQMPVVAPTCFDDETSWTDDDDNEYHGLEDNSCLKKPIPASVTAANSSSPPTSKLMSQLFPKLKPKPSAETEKANQILQQAASQPIDMSNQQSQNLREKLMKLDVEIEKFRLENANLDKLRREREEGLAKLNQQIDSFQKQKEDELRRLEEFKTEEMKKLKRERKLFENYQKKIRSMPDKKDREEIDMLRTQLQELQDELKHKESRWSASNTRLKNRIADLELENGELKEEIRILERRRLEWMSGQSHMKAAPLGNGKVLNGESAAGKSGGANKQTSVQQTRSSTPATDMDKVKAISSAVPTANSGTLKPAIASHTSANSGTTKNGKINIGNNVSYKTQNGLVSQAQNGVATSAMKSVASKHATPSVNLSGEGIQSNSVPKMMENTLPVATQVSAMPGSIMSSPGSLPGKSAALLAMEHTVMDKGDVSLFTETRHQDGKIEKTFKTGAKEIYFPNGTVKEISADGQTVVCRLANGDIRQIFPDHRVVYIFAEAEIMQTTFPDGLEMLQFKNSQIERRYPDGTVEITFPSKDVKYLFPDGGQEVRSADGTIMRYSSNGETVVEYPSGDREIHTAEYQRREFPDGIVKTVYSDGRHETRFPNGRIRLKDKSGNVIMDQIVYR